MPAGGLPVLAPVVVQCRACLTGLLPSDKQASGVWGASPPGGFSTQRPTGLLRPQSTLDPENALVTFNMKVATWIYLLVQLLLLWKLYCSFQFECCHLQVSGPHPFLLSTPPRCAAGIAVKPVVMRCSCRRALG